MVSFGIDIGSTTSKCILLRDGQEIIGSSLVVGGIGTDGPRKAVQQVFEAAGISPDEASVSAVTGYGRSSWKDADFQVSELTCHAMGGRFIFPELRTLIDIGGQDAKAIALDKSGMMKNFLMNDKCAAGTGRFLDVMATILQVSVNELGTLALTAQEHASISSTCTGFAESEVISQLASGADRTAVMAGICDSVATRTATLAKRVGIVEPVCISGGVARNAGVRAALEKALGVKLLYSELSQHFGALGAAVYAYRKSGAKSE